MPYQIDPPPEENEFECARCGAHVHMMLNRCPQCGVNLYEPEDDEEVEGNYQPRRGRPGSGFFDKARLFINRLLGKKGLADELFGVYEVQMALYRDLLRKVGGDAAVVERLVQYEEEIQPDANRTVWLQNAIGRWESDNS